MLIIFAGPAQALVVYDKTSVTFAWSPAPGPVAGYYVIITRNSEPAKDLVEVIGTNQLTVQSQYGETVQLWVMAFNDKGEWGPVSEASFPVTFEQSAPPPDPDPPSDPPSPPPDPEPIPEPTPEPEPVPDYTVGTPFDLDGDGMSDALVQHSVTGAVELRSIGADGLLGETALALEDANAAVRGNGDYDGDGTADILWRDTLSGRVSISYMEAGQVVETVVIHNALASSWEIVGSADYDGDGLTDILLHNTSNNAFERWSFDGSAYAATPLPDDFRDAADVIASGDFDGDGMADVLWRHPASGDVDIWGTTGNLTFATLEGAGDAWSIIGAGDFDGDGRHDLLLRSSTNVLAVRLASDGILQPVQSGANTNDRNRSVVGIGDYDGDGRSDLLLFEKDNHASYSIWYMQGATSTSTADMPRAGYRASYVTVDWRKPGSL